jgi:hypothetical protein
MPLSTCNWSSSPDELTSVKLFPSGNSQTSSELYVWILGVLFELNDA